MATTFCNDRSVLNHQWKLREPQEENSQDAHNSSTKLLISSELETILKGRGVKDIAKWLEPRLAYLKDPHILNNMEEAISLFCQGIEENKKIGILGDYDVDGATSTAILIRFMRLLDHEKYEY